MKRIEVTNPASLDTLKVYERDRPKPAAGDLLVRVRATSLNFHDYLVATGVLPVATGRVPMSDGVGEVVEVGAGVTAYKPGDRVLGTFFPNWQDGLPVAEKVSAMAGDHVDGFAREYVVMPARTFTAVPSHLNDFEAATLPCAGLTAWHALFVEGDLKPGDTVLVQGTGGVSIFALQFAKMTGATVVALSSSEAKLERLKQMGADHVINYRTTPEWGRQVREVTAGRGVDHVVEVVGGDLGQSVQACRTGGSVYLIGLVSRKPLQLMGGALITGNKRVIGFTVGSRAEQQDMVRAIETAKMKPVVDKVFPLEELGQAFRHQEAQAHFGKICVSCST